MERAPDRGSMSAGTRCYLKLTEPAARTSGRETNHARRTPKYSRTPPPAHLANVGSWSFSSDYNVAMLPDEEGMVVLEHISRGKRLIGSILCRIAMRPTWPSPVVCACEGTTC
jgi:hypothetical protein